MDAPAKPAIGRRDDAFAADQLAKRTIRSATSSGCSTTLVAWLTTPGRINFPSGSFTSCHTRHSCSWRTLPASNE